MCVQETEREERVKKKKSEMESVCVCVLPPRPDAPILTFKTHSIKHSTLGNPRAVSGADLQVHDDTNSILISWDRRPRRTN